ncbi:MAG: enoyl-CoA hydratase-related protein [Pseudomonadota bacterium]
MIHISHAAPGVLLARIDRPQRMNSLTDDMYGQLREAMRECLSSSNLSVLLITGSSTLFTSGNDVAEFSSSSGKTSDDKRRQGGPSFLREVASFEKILLFAVEGYAVGIGTTLLLHADGVYAGSSAKFKLPFIDLALTPEAGSSLLLPLRAGYLRAAAAVLLGEQMSGPQALEAGLVTELTADGASLDRALAVANLYASKPLGALMEAKSLMRIPFQQLLASTMEREALAFAARRNSADAQDRFRNFLAKSGR